jgi:hypothetical protein
MSRLDVKLTARAASAVDDAVESASDDVDKLCGRVFWPQLATRTFDWPDRASPTPWRLWLDDDVVSVSSLVAGGTTIASTDYFLRPDDGPPYRRVELDLASSAAFSGATTHQHAVSVTGLWGYGADETPAGTLGEALDASETAVDVSDSAAVGVGDLVRVDSERMLVTGKSNLDTGQNLGGNLTASTADVAVAVSSGAAFAVGETLTIDTERFRVDDVTGDTLTVRRAWDGSVLAAHTAGADVYAPRTLTVARGYGGTAAATHTTATALYRHVAPAPVRQLARALALVAVLQEPTGWARTVGSGENERQASGRGVRELCDGVYGAFGLKARARAV